MKTNFALVMTALVSLSLLLVQCNKSNNTHAQANAPTLPESPYHYQIDSNNMMLGSRNNTPNDNKLTDAGATLGRVLFFDKKLSINNQTACGSCHLQANAFADNVAESNGFEGKKTSRNSSTIINVINQQSYFWDGRTSGLEEMVLQPIRHQVEMGMEKSDILPKKLSIVGYYPELFQKAFGTTDITKERISKALSQFLRSMTSYNSFADQTHLMSGGPNAGWGFTNDPRVTNEQKNGAQLFVNSGCINCHSGNNLRGWNDDGVANIGLELNYTDKGLGETDASKVGMFKIPSLRNVALTAPYMHDGRFKTLKEVVNHYNAGVVNHPNLSNMLTTNPWGTSTIKEPRRLNLTETQKNNLVTFLQTLNDQTIVTDVRFSDPFAK
jgi:cytochrome c peroxidase